MRRSPALVQVAKIYGYSAVVAGGFCLAAKELTEMGKGSRAHVDNEWVAGMAVSCALDDLKNTAMLLDAFAYCRLNRDETRFILQTESKPNALAGVKHDFEFKHRAYPFKDEEAFDSPLNELIGVMTYIAEDWGGEFHQRSKLGYRIDINTSPTFWVEISSAFTREQGDASYLRRRYYPDAEAAERLKAPGLFPRMKRVSIYFDQIEAMAAILADSLAYEKQTEAKPNDFSLLPPEASAVLAPASENDNADDLSHEASASSSVQPCANTTGGCSDLPDGISEKKVFQGYSDTTAGHSLMTDEGNWHGPALAAYSFA